MTDLQSLYAGICAQPDEDTPRLALADFLDEEGGKENAFRADFIRTHVQLARAEPWSVPWRELNARWNTLNAAAQATAVKHKLSWVAHLKGRVRAWAFERGLVGHLTLFSKRFVSEGESYFEQDPIRSVKFVKLDSAMGAVKPDVLFACPYLARIAKLDFEGSGLKGPELGRLAASPHVGGLRALALGGNNPFGATALPKLVASLPALTELDLGRNVQVGDGHLKELAKCPQLSRIGVLDLNGAAVTADGVAALAASKHATGLTVLRLMPEETYDEEHGYGTYSHVGAERGDGIAAASAIAASGSLGALQELVLSYRGIGDEGLTALVGAAKRFTALRRLHLDACGLTPPAVKALAASEIGTRLLYLNLDNNPALARDRGKLKKLFPGAHVEEPFAYDE